MVKNIRVLDPDFRDIQAQNPKKVRFCTFMQCIKKLEIIETYSIYAAFNTECENDVSFREKINLHLVLGH